MIGAVARETHKHFRDVNKCVHPQRGAVEVFPRLPHRKCSFFFLSYIDTHQAHAYTKSFSVFSRRMSCSSQLGVISYNMCFSVTFKMSQQGLFLAHSGVLANFEIRMCQSWLLLKYLNIIFILQY